MNSSKRLRRNLLAKVHLCLFVCRQNNMGWGRNEGGIGVLLCMSELEVHSFPIAKQLLCLPGFHMFTKIKGYISCQLWTNIQPSIPLSDKSPLCCRFKATVAEIHYRNMVSVWMFLSCCGGAHI